tara:strand:- start:14827 stop:15570 length:744 start_codon:yes stop_codon:yes gene_type:complete
MKITLIGGGKLGEHLYKVLISVGQVQLLKWVIRSREESLTPEGINIVNKIDQDEKCDIYLIAVSDNSIKEVVQLLPKDSFVVHTSGSISLKEIKRDRAGVFYPIQTFTKGSDVNFSEIFVGLESKNSKDLMILKKLAKHIGSKSFVLNSSKREQLHLAAVLVNNFTNHLFAEANLICKKNNLPFDILLPLIKETVQKVEKLSPKNSQTGPASRNDSETISKQIKLITNSRLKKIYKVLTSAIQECND